MPNILLISIRRGICHTIYTLNTITINGYDKTKVSSYFKYWGGKIYMDGQYHKSWL